MTNTAPIDDDSATEADDESDDTDADADDPPDGPPTPSSAETDGGIPLLGQPPTRSQRTRRVEGLLDGLACWIAVVFAATRRTAVTGFDLDDPNDPDTSGNRDGSRYETPDSPDNPDSPDCSDDPDPPDGPTGPDELTDPARLDGSNRREAARADGSSAGTAVDTRSVADAAGGSRRDAGAAARASRTEDECSAGSAAVDLSDAEYYLNRELSELEFQRRVLNEALDERNPLLERVRFLAIFTRNTDEFVRKRIGGLKQQMAVNVTELSPDGQTPYDQWVAALETARPLFERQTACYREEIRPALADAGIRIVDHDDLGPASRRELREYFETSVLPMLTPLTFDPAHPFPFISNLSLSLAVLTREENATELTFSRVKIPKNRPRLVRVDGAADGAGAVFVRLEQLVTANLDLLFPDVEVVDCSAFRVTRNAEVERNEEGSEDLVAMIENVLRERRFAMAVRLEIETGMAQHSRELLMDQLDVHEREVFELDAPLDFTGFDAIADLDRPDLRYDAWTPQPHPRFEVIDRNRRDTGGPEDVFAAIRAGDVLLHHPYHSFSGTVQRFLDAAATDPDVHAIKIAIYRTATDSAVIESLIEAARNGKQVAVMVELKARFDEKNNLGWVEKLEDEGIHVAYGTLGYKTHTKTALVVREEPDGMQLYSHVATGNYHSETAKAYTDLGLLTADRTIGRDLVQVFNYFTGHSHYDEYRTLLVAPGNMRERFVEYIRREAALAREGADGRVVAKMNRLEDPAIVEELYRASQAGVEIDLVVRDICRLRPGLEGVSETIRVHSVVGRLLEHSRIFYFGNDGDPKYFIGSADWMTRNLDRRVEAIAPVEDPALCEQLWAILEAALNDNRRRWEMEPDGSYRQCTPGDEPVRDSQELFMRHVRRGNGPDDPDDAR